MDKKEAPKSSLDALVSLCKRRGFIFQSSEVYGGFAGFWDYGPLGCELKRNIMERWWRFMVRDREDVEGLDASIIMHPAIWKASGHLETFSDPMSMCKGNCRKLMRSDQVWELFEDSAIKAALAPLVGDAGAVANWCKGKGKGIAPGLYTVQHPEHLETIFEALKTVADVRALFLLLATPPEAEGEILPCPNCGGVMTEPRPFNLMFKTVVGPVDDPDNVAYLRPETAQAIFADFANVMVASRQAPPFGIGQAVHAHGTINGILLQALSRQAMVQRQHTRHVRTDIINHRLVIGVQIHKIGKLVGIDIIVLLVALHKEQGDKEDNACMEKLAAQLSAPHCEPPNN